MLQKLLQEYAPDFLAVAFDKGKKTFRNEMFAEYKGTRKPTPPELSAHLSFAKNSAPPAIANSIMEEQRIKS